MGALRFLWFFISVVLFSCSIPHGKVIEVRAAQSVNVALQQANEGDTILLHAGVYREKIIFTKNNIVLKGAPKEHVVLTGAVEVKNWIKASKNFYKAYCKKEVLQLFNKGTMLLPARWPNFDTTMYSTRNWKKVYTSKDSSVFVGSSFGKKDWKGAWCYAIAGKKWVVNVEQVASSKDSILKMKNTWFNYQGKWYTGDGEAYLMKHLNALDTLNEWHWQNDTLYVMLDHQPTSLEAQQKEVLILGDKVENIVLENLTLQGGRIQFSNSENITIHKLQVLNGTAPRIYEYSNGAAYAAIEFIGESEYCSVQNSIVDGNWGAGIYLEGEYHVVNNCVVSNCCWMGNGTANIATNGYGHQITFCDVFNSGKFLIVHNNTKHITIKNNHLYNGGYLANDLGLTYAYQTDGDNSEIAYNIVHGNYAKEAGVGIYIDMNSKKFLIHHNVVYDCLYGIQTVMDCYDHEIYNNTIHGKMKAINYWGVDGSNMYNQKVYNNLASDIFDAGTDIQYNLSTNENFYLDSLHGNFQLQKGARAIDYGVIIPGITEEYIGAKPDVGAFEYGMPAWGYGCNKTLLKQD